MKLFQKKLKNESKKKWKKHAGAEVQVPSQTGDHLLIKKKKRGKQANDTFFKNVLWVELVWVWRVEFYKDYVFFLPLRGGVKFEYKEEGLYHSQSAFSIPALYSVSLAKRLIC